MAALGRLRLVGAGLATAVAVAACGGQDTGSTELTAIQAEVIGQTAAVQLGGLVNGLAHFHTPAVGGLAGGFLAAPGGQTLATTLGRLNPRVGPSLALLSQADGCVPSQSDPTDTDGDGIPDDNVVTFTAGNCTVTDTTGSEPLTITVVGSMRIQDTDGATTLFGYRVGITGFSVTLKDTLPDTPDLQVSVSGSFDATVGSTLASASQDLRTALRFDGTKLFGDHASWALGYTPTGGAITLGEILPAGQFTVNGSYAWSGSYNGADGDWSFALQTPLPLAWDGACNDEQWPFASGQVKGAITARRSVGFTVDYAGCGVIGTITAYGISALRL